MQKSNNTAFYGVLAIMITGACFMASYMWIIPQLKDNKSKSAIVSSDLGAAEAKLASVSKVSAKLTTLSDTVNSMFIAIPKDNDTENIITLLEQLASSNKIYIPTFQIGEGGQASADPETSVSTSSGNVVSISFGVTGSLADISSFIAAIESDIKFFNVKSMVMSSSDSVISMTITLDAYKQAPSSVTNS